MGRQAYITRLALGRSPYEAPILSETGDFILGPYAHEFDNTDGYTQQYNERGHPEFRASRAAARELRRAKNDVLSTVGVVYKKAKPTRPKKNDGALIKMVQSENESGTILSCVDNLLMFCSLWWLFSLRMRVLAFESYSVPLIQIIKSELRVFGMNSFLFVGLPACLVSATLNNWRRYWMDERVKEWVAHHGLQQIFELLFFLLCSSIKAFGILQSLHLNPAGQAMNVMSFVSLIRHSFVQLSNSLVAVSTSPILVLWAYTSLSQYLQTTLWYVIRNLTLKPDAPDRISYLALEGTRITEAKVPGFREQPWTWSDEARYQSFLVGNWLRDLLWLFSKPFQTSETGLSHLPIEPAIPPPALPGEADPDRASTATPDPEDLFNMDDIEQHLSRPFSLAEPRLQPLSRANTLFTPLNQSPATTPPASPHIRASLIGRDSETVTMQLELLDSQREVEGVEEEVLHNQSLEALEDVATNNSDHASAEAEAGPETADVETMVSELTRAIRERDEADGGSSAHEGNRPGNKRRHRVTTLSNLPAEAFASHAACLITTAVLLPLETLFVRSLAKIFLGSSLLGRDVRPLFEWRGWSWRYTGTMIGLLGLQTFVSSVVWGLGTSVAIGLGRTRYQWGKL